MIDFARLIHHCQQIIGLLSQGMVPDLVSVATMCHFHSKVPLMEKGAGNLLARASREVLKNVAGMMMRKYRG